MAFIPAEAFHPSEYIREEIEARGWSLDDLASRLPGSFGINRLALDFYMDVGPIDPGIRMGPMASEISGAFGVDADLFSNLEKAWLGHPTTIALSAKTEGMSDA